MPLTSEEYGTLMRPVGKSTQRGGFQRLIERLQRGCRWRLSGGWELSMSNEDATRVLEYSKPSYGAGTYQSQLRTIEERVRGALDVMGAKQ